jgi:hypothetical protein
VHLYAKTLIRFSALKYGGAAIMALKLLTTIETSDLIYIVLDQVALFEVRCTILWHENGCNLLQVLLCQGLRDKVQECSNWDSLLSSLSNSREEYGLSRLEIAGNQFSPGMHGEAHTGGHQRGGYATRFTRRKLNEVATIEDLTKSDIDVDNDRRLFVFPMKRKALVGYV